MLGHWGEGQRGQAESRGDAGKEEEAWGQGPANPVTSLSFHLPAWVGFCLYQVSLCRMLRDQQVEQALHFVHQAIVLVLTFLFLICLLFPVQLV